MDVQLHVPDSTRPGIPTRITATVVDAETGEPIEDLTPSHEAWMHLIATRDDLGTFAHVHPEPTGNAGELAVDLTFPTAGRYIVNTEFRQQGQMNDVHQAVRHRHRRCPGAGGADRGAARVRRRRRPLPVAITAAVGAGLVLALIAVVQRRPFQQALAGLAAVTVAASYAAWGDEARAYFLPGIWVDAAYAIVLAGSVLAGRPLIGTVHDWLLTCDRRRWREDTRLHRAVVILTLGWAGLYALRASVQAALYAGDHPELLAVAKLSLGWPLTIATAAVSLAWLRHVEEHDPTTGKADGMTTWRAPARLSQSRN